MMLEIQKLLREKGLDQVVADLKLIRKEKGDLVLLKYNQIESDYSIRAVQECRGIILDKANNFNVVCLAFTKFFNSQEGFAHPIDWDTAKCYKKYDGSIMTLYNYQGVWHVATSGTIDADTNSNDVGISFKDLFWKTVSLFYKDNKGTKDLFTRYLGNDMCYIFEMCTPQNVVITQHTEYKLILLGVRNRVTLKEYTCEEVGNAHGFVYAETYDLNNIDKMVDTFKDMTWQDEGYVVCDANFNRIKLKNPAYVSVHHTKGKLSAYHIMTIIKTNEVDEFVAVFAERKDELYMLRERYNKLEEDLTRIWTEELQNKYESQKDFALAVFEKLPKHFTGLMFSLYNGKRSTVRSYLEEMDNKFLYFLLVPENAEELAKTWKLHSV